MAAHLAATPACHLRRLSPAVLDDRLRGPGQLGRIQPGLAVPVHLHQPDPGAAACPPSPPSSPSAPATGLAVSCFAGSIADRLGRKPVMFAAQAAQALAWLLMSRAGSYLGFLLPMTILAAAQPVYSVGSDAMMADLLTPGTRASGYSILRTFNNAGHRPGAGGGRVHRVPLVRGRLPRRGPGDARLQPVPAVLRARDAAPALRERAAEAAGSSWTCSGTGAS